MAAVIAEMKKPTLPPCRQRSGDGLSQAAIAKLNKSRRPDSSGLFIASPGDIATGSLYGRNLPEKYLVQRVKAKISFLRGYLVYISYDGAEFMDSQSSFLTLQYPSRCNNVWGIWLEQEVREGMEPGDHFGYDGMEVSIFVKEISGFDFASAHTILPFDRIHLRRPKGARWARQAVEIAIEEIRNDLGFDGLEFGCETEFASNSPVLTLNFVWK